MSVLQRLRPLSFSPLSLFLKPRLCPSLLLARSARDKDADLKTSSLPSSSFLSNARPSRPRLRRSSPEAFALVFDVRLKGRLALDLPQSKHKNLKRNETESTCRGIAPLSTTLRPSTRRQNIFRSTRDAWLPKDPALLQGRPFVAAEIDSFCFVFRVEKK